MEIKTCKSCSTPFEITDKDLAFYEKTQATSPTLCPDCRLKRRLAWRNETHLYKRNCDLCEKPFISLYRADSSYVVYCPECWWSDKWDPSKYYENLNFDEPFFTQLDRLLKKTPHVGIITDRPTLVNSDYVAYVSDAKNCYLVYAANFLEDCMHSHYIWETKDSIDCSNSTKLELCYECVDCDQLFNCDYLEDSQICHDCTLSYNLKNCEHCFGCVNLRHKSFHIFNKPATEEEYRKTVHEFLNDKQKHQEFTEKFNKFKFEFPRLSALLSNCENSTGDAIKNCKNCTECFEGYGGEDLKWVQNFPGQTKDCYDVFGCAEVELALECHCTGLPTYNVKYCSWVMNGSRDILYSVYLMNGGHDLFGCVSLKKSEYCILNKKYSEEEYKTLKAKLIEHMKKTGEWGEFFPSTLSPFKYEETVANAYFPL